MTCRENSNKVVPLLLFFTFFKINIIIQSVGHYRESGLLSFFNDFRFCFITLPDGPTSPLDVRAL
jgi:hypothetical protein